MFFLFAHFPARTASLVVCVTLNTLFFCNDLLIDDQSVRSTLRRLGQVIKTLSLVPVGVSCAFDKAFASFLINLLVFRFRYCSMTYIVDQLFPPIKLTDDDDCIEYTSFNYWRDPVFDVDLDISGSSSPTSDNPNTSLQAIQSKPLATIPEN